MSIETFEYKGYKINIEQDEDASNPREDGDNLSVMACFHKRYNLGDENHGYRPEDYGSWDEMMADIIRKEKPAAIAQLYLYDHSGLRIKVGSFQGLLPQGHAEFDSGPIGFIWITKEAAKENWGWKRITKDRLEQVHKYIQGDVSTYDDYISGAVYRWSVEDPEGEQVDGIGCGGFYGFDSIKENGDAMTEAKAEIDYEIESRAKSEAKAALPENKQGQLTLGLEGVV